MRIGIVPRRLPGFAFLFGAVVFLGLLPGELFFYEFGAFFGVLTDGAESAGEWTDFVPFVVFAAHGEIGFFDLDAAFGEVVALVGDFVFEEEFLLAQGTFSFLDGDLAFASGGVALAAEDGADAVELFEVRGVVVRGEREV